MCGPMGQICPQTGESLVKMLKGPEYKSRRIEFKKEKYVSANGATMVVNRITHCQKFPVRIIFFCVVLK